MSRIPIRFALLVAMTAVGMALMAKPGPTGGRLTAGSVPPAEAFLPPAAWRPPAIALARVAAGLGAARVQGYAGTVDHPRAPLGHFKVTAYSGPQLGGAYPITASGTRVRAGRTVAVDPRVIPLGSRVYIEGIGERVAEDTGGKVKGHHIDVYVPNPPQARKFGVQRAKVTVLAPPDNSG